ncbi:MAG: MBL fold metallo-hydrolase [Hyphomicrobiaceae bacterium]
MRLTLLGTGTPAPSLKRMGSGYLLEIEDDLIVFDHGPGAHQRFLETGHKATSVTHCFLSHLHYDHFMDFPRLLMTRWDQGAGKVPELDVFGPEPLPRIMEQVIGRDGIYAADIEARTRHEMSLDIYRARGGELPRQPPAPRVQKVQTGDVIERTNWRVTVGSGWHAEPYLSCLAYRIESSAGSICYSGDSGGVCPDIIALARGCDILVHMNHFFSGTEPSEAYRRSCGNHIDTAQVAKEAGVGTVVLTHITEQIDQVRVRERIIREMAGIFSGHIIWGEDLMEIPIEPPPMLRID